MFDENIVRKLVEEHKKLLEEMAKIEEELNERFFNFKEPVRALILSVLSDETLLLVGPPGTGKSQLIRDFCELIGILSRKDWVHNLNKANNTKKDKLVEEAEASPYYFEYLLTRFTEPGELFGYFDIGKLQHAPYELERDITGMMQQATVVYLDEIFRGSSAILNALLAFLNERIFHDRGDVVDVKVQALFSATNDIPTTADLQAVFDRFVVRCWVHNLADNEPEGTNHLTEQIVKFLKKAWPDTYRSNHQEVNDYRRRKLFKDIKNLNKKIEEHSKLSLDPEKKSEKPPILLLESEETKHYTDGLAQIVATLADKGLGQISNRRLVKMVHLMLLATIYRTSKEGEQATCKPTVEELKLYRYFLDVDPHSEAVRDDIVKLDKALEELT